MGSNDKNPLLNEDPPTTSLFTTRVIPSLLLQPEMGQVLIPTKYEIGESSHANDIGENPNSTSPWPVTRAAPETTTLVIPALAPMVPSLTLVVPAPALVVPTPVNASPPIHAQLCRSTHQRVKLITLRSFVTNTAIRKDLKISYPQLLIWLEILLTVNNFLEAVTEGYCNTLTRFI